MTLGRLLVAGRYRLREPVGVGGMGRVWRAHDEMLDRAVAVKEFLPPEWLTEAERDKLRHRTLREARSAARLNHPHVVRIYDVVHAHELPWIVMEYVASRSLHQVVGEDGPLSPAQVAPIGLAVLDALTAAHRAGVLHRDVKPHNVLIGDDGRVVLTDFGLATFPGDGAVTGPGPVVGSPQYVSPERAREGASTVESDLWSFGATLYAALEGRPPYARDNAMATLTALATEPPDPPTRAGPLAPLLAGLLRRDPAARITAAEAAALLRQVADDARPTAPVPPPRPPSTGPPPPPPALPPAPPRAGVPPDALRIAAPKAPLRRVSPFRHLLAAAIVLLVAVLGGGGLTPRPGPSASFPVGVGEPTTPPAVPTDDVSPLACAGPAPAGLPRTPLPAAPANPTPTNPTPAGRESARYALPPGWSYYQDGTGFQVAVPDGWTVQRVRDVRCFREPGGGRVLSVGTPVPQGPSADPVPQGTPVDPVTACRAAARRLTAALPGYAEVAISRVPFVAGAADWEFRYADPAGDRWHVSTRWSSVGGRAYTLGWLTREFDWPTNRSNLAMVQVSFTPGG